MSNVFSRRELGRRFLLFLLLGSWCAVMLLARVIYSHSLTYSFLAWNLFLAALPLAMGTCFAWSYARRLPVLLQAGFFTLWLAFFPNAPYILTDFIHLRERLPVPLWFDIALLASFAGTGLFFGYASLAELEAVIAQKFSTLAGWALALGVLLLSGFGIYLGRFLRWNSWDALANPFGLFADIAQRILHPLSHPRTAAVTIIYGVLLCLGYVALKLIRPGALSAAHDGLVDQHRDS